MTKQVLQQALEALELAVRQNSHDMILTGEELRDGEAAIAALRSALAQQGEQPCAHDWGFDSEHSDGSVASFTCHLCGTTCESNAPAAQPTCKQDLQVETEQERYVRMCPDIECGRKKRCTRMVGFSCMSRADIAAAPAAQPDARKVIEELLYCVKAWERGCLHEDYRRDRDDAITEGQEWLEENK